MKKTIPFIFFVLTFASCKTISINAWKDPMKCCKVYSVTKMEYGKDDYYPGVHPDTISVLNITVAQTNSNYKIEGPDYCFLYVINTQNDTLARSVISGLPTTDNPRTYQAFGDQKWKIKPEVSTLRIYLENYCDNIPTRKK